MRLNPQSPSNGCFLASRFALALMVVCALGASRAAAQQQARDASLLKPPNVSFGASLAGELDPWTDPSGFAYAPPSPGDSDLGDQLMLMPQTDYKPFNFRLSQQVLWTSNAGLTDKDTLDDVYSNSEVGFSYIPQITGNTYGEISAEYSFFRYANNSFLDFDSLEASAGVIHVFRELNDLSGWFRYNHLRLLEGRGHDELFTDHTLEVGLYYPIPIGRKHLAFGSYNSEFSLGANPGFSRRHEHSATLGYIFFPTDRIELSAYYEFFVLDYTDVDRVDLLHNVGISAAYRIRKGIDLILQGTYSLNDSDFSESGFDADYKVGDVGGTISIQLEF